MPDEWLGGGAVIRALMSTQVWKVLFPELESEYDANQRVDLRCGWNKDYLKKGNLRDSSISQIQFRDGNMIDMNLHFGCGLYVYESGQKTEVEQLVELF
jgi:hypothetical protein